MIIEDHAADLTVISHRRRQRHPNLDAEKLHGEMGKSPLHMLLLVLATNMAKLDACK